MIKVLLLPLALMSSFSPSDIKTSEDLLQAMHKHYASSWYKTLTFVQATKRYKPDSTLLTSTWYEAFSFPGSMRIDMDSIGYNGIIFSRDSQYVFREGKLVSTRRSVHLLLLLGFDIYFLPVQETLARLKESRIDLSILREDTWQGRAVYVVGAKKEDSHSSQFWIDKERLTFVRLLQPAARDGAQTQEVQFNKYERLSGGWISPEVIIKLDDKIIMTEEYSEIKAGVKLDPRLFDPQHWQTARWR
jgi:hypothetical protein